MHQKVPAGFGGRLRGKGPPPRDLAAQPILLPGIGPQHGPQMALAVDQQPVSALRPYGLYRRHPAWAATAC